MPSALVRGSLAAFAAFAFAAFATFCSPGCPGIRDLGAFCDVVSLADDVEAKRAVHAGEGAPLIDEVAAASGLPVKILARYLRVSPVDFLRECLLLPKAFVGDHDVGSDRGREIHRGLYGSRVSDRGHRGSGHDGGDGRLLDHRGGSGHDHGVKYGGFERDLGHFRHGQIHGLNTGIGRRRRCLNTWAFAGIQSRRDTVAIEEGTRGGVEIRMAGHASH